MRQPRLNLMTHFLCVLPVLAAAGNSYRTKATTVIATRVLYYNCLYESAETLNNIL